MEFLDEKFFIIKIKLGIFRPLLPSSVNKTPPHLSKSQRCSTQKRGHTPTPKLLYEFRFGLK